MKLYKSFLHFLLTLGSITAFLMGWASIAHSLKPIQPISDQANLAPLLPVGQTTTSSSSNFLQQFFSTSPRQSSRSTFMSRGS